MAETQPRLDSSGLSTLQQLALGGSLESAQKVSCASLADRLDTSTQTASRRLQGLDEDGYVTRDVVSDGQWVEITESGEQRLRTEYERYRQIFERDPGVTLSGAVTSGMGEGRHYISLSGYMTQFREKLGYEPYPGTLNVDLDEASIRARPQLDPLDPVTIEGWETEERTYGPAYCHPATVEANGQSFEQSHVISPERTHHGDDHLEIIAPDELRETLSLDDGTEVTVRVTE